MKHLMSAVVIFSLAGLTATHAAQIMPDFADLPTGWSTDRYAPHAFDNVGTFQGRDNVLGLQVDSAEGYNNRVGGYQSSNYSTQGKYHLVSGAGSTILSADLWISSTWSTEQDGSIRTEMWGVMTDGSAVTDFPIIGFANLGNTPRFRVYDPDTIGWTDLSTPVVYGAWNSLSLDFTGTSYVYSINGSVAYIDDTVFGSTEFSAAMLQAYNFFDDPETSGANAVNYTAHWANASVPESTATLSLLGFALVIIAASRSSLNWK